MWEFELLTSDCQRFLNPSRICLYNRFTNFCQRWLNWNKSRVWAWCYFAFPVQSLWRLCTYQCYAGGGWEGWEFDCLCWPWGRAFDWFCSPRGGDIWIFLLPTWKYLTADSDEKDWDRTYVSHFHASRMRRMVWKDLEIMEANENKRNLGGFPCFVVKFRLF